MLGSRVPTRAVARAVPERVIGVCATLLLAAGGAILGHQVWLSAKAVVAAELIDRAFEAHLSDGAAHPPWRWAEIHPVARLEVPRLDIRRTVLAGHVGDALAFGAGHVAGTSGPNQPGNCAIAGHRDGWFAFLADVRPGDEIVLRSREGVRTYVVSDRLVIDEHDLWVLRQTTDRRLTLITCFPFDEILHGPRRLAVICVPPPGATAERPGRDVASVVDSPGRPAMGEEPSTQAIRTQGDSAWPLQPAPRN